MAEDAPLPCAHRVGLSSRRGIFPPRRPCARPIEVGSRLSAAIAAVMHDRAQEERAATGSARQAPLHRVRAAGIAAAGDDAEVGARLPEAHARSHLGQRTAQAPASTSLMMG